MITFKENSKSENEPFTSGVSILSAGNGLLGFSTRTCNTSMFFYTFKARSDLSGVTSYEE